MLYTSPWSIFDLTTSVVIGTEGICSCRSNYHTITTKMGPSLCYVKAGYKYGLKFGVYHYYQIFIYIMTIDLMQEKNPDDYIELTSERSRHRSMCENLIIWYVYRCVNPHTVVLILWSGVNYLYNWTINVLTNIFQDRWNILKKKTLFLSWNRVSRSAVFCIVFCSKR